MSMDAKSYEEMFLSTLGRRLKTVQEKKKHYESNTVVSLKGDNLSPK